MNANLTGFVLEVGRLTAWLAILAAIFVPLERLFALHRRTRGLKGAAEDVAYYFLNSLLPLAVLAPPIALLAAVAHRLLPTGYTAFIGELPLWAKLAAGVIVGDLGGYWGHRLSHQTPLLWRFHVVHHAPRHISWLVSARAHPVDQVVQKLSALAPLTLLGLAQPTPQGLGLAAYVAVFGTIWGFFIHANVRWRLGPLEWIVATPAFHHWHHTVDQHRDRNYAALFPWMDRLFGTHYLPKGWPPDYGVDSPQPATMAGELLAPLGLGGPADAPGLPRR